MIAERKSLMIPVDGVAVTDLDLPNGLAGGAIDDGLEGYFSTTWTSGSQKLTLLTANLSVTVTNTGGWKGGTVAKLSFPDFGSDYGIAFSREWVGTPVAISGAGDGGGVFTATVVGFFYDWSNGGAPTALLSSAVPVELNASAQDIACPCFLPAHRGKNIWISNATGMWRNNPIKSVPLSCKISSVESPFSVTLSTPVTTTSQCAVPGSLIRWGTDNTGAVINAGQAALAAGHKKLYFPGGSTDSSTGLFLLFDSLRNFQVEATESEHDLAEVWASLVWIGSNARMRMMSIPNTNYWHDNQTKKELIPAEASAPPAPYTSVKGAAHLPRCASQQRLVVVLTGDSWAIPDPSGTAGNMLLGRLAAEIQQQNPGKPIHFINRALGGSTWQWLAGGPPPRQNLPWWYTDRTQPWLKFIETVPVAGLGNVSPDLVVIYEGGGNEGLHSGTILKNDIMAVINTIKSWTTANGHPPDVLLGWGPTKGLGVAGKSAGFSEVGFLYNEYVTGLIRSVARSNRIGHIDLGTPLNFAMDGWAPDRLVLRQVPPLQPGKAGLVEPYSLQYNTRDFFVALELIAKSGSGFWAAAGSLSLTLSVKPDNRIWFSIDPSDNLVVTGVAWGCSIATPITTSAGSAMIETSGQSLLTAESFSPNPAPPSYVIGASNPFSSGMVGTCLLFPRVSYNGADFRTFMTAYVTQSLIHVSDANAIAPSYTTTLYQGGHMFVASDARAQVDVIIGGAGSAAHPFCDGACLVTKIIGYSSHTTVELGAPAEASLSASSQTVFVGSISFGPVCTTAVAAGADCGPNPILTIQVRGTYVRVGYLPGGKQLGMARRSVAQAIPIWEGEVERMGGPFVPRLYASGDVTVGAVALWLGERDIRLPAATMREVCSIGEPSYSYPYGGDGSHFSQIAIERVIDDVMGRQDFSTGAPQPSLAGSVAPKTGFVYQIPNNQAFTEITPRKALSEGTIILPASLPQGARLEIFSTQPIESLTVLSPPGYRLQGESVCSIGADGVIAFRLIKNRYCRV